MRRLSACASHDVSASRQGAVCQQSSLLACLLDRNSEDVDRGEDLPTQPQESAQRVADHVMVPGHRTASAMDVLAAE